MSENKKVTLEFTEEYIRAHAEQYNYDLSKKTPPMAFFERCKEWVAANPPEPKMRPMTDKERMEWALENKDMEISIICQTFTTNFTQIKNFPLNTILKAECFIDTIKKEHKFEVPE